MYVKINFDTLIPSSCITFMNNESFNFQIELILKKYGIVVITRTGYNVADIIEEHDILYQYMVCIIDLIRHFYRIQGDSRTV